MGMAPSAASPATDVVNAKTLPGAIPASSAARLPSSAAQYRALQSDIAKSRPAVEDAKRNSDSLKAEAQTLRRRLIDTAARIQSLETEQLQLASVIAKLTSNERTLAKNFSQQRAQVIALLAVLERMQHDSPPVMAIRAGDALAAAHSSMLLGAALPRLYSATAELSRRLDVLQRTRVELLRQRGEEARNASALASARSEIDQLLAMKSKEAEEADARYDDLAAKLGASSEKAANLDALLRRVASLQGAPAPLTPIVVVARTTNANFKLHGLLQPVIGRVERGEGGGPGALQAPGISFLAPAAAQVVAPADSEVLFAGPYHKTGQVLILQTPSGYDLVLAGLGRVDVRTGNQLLAGEPVGRMPQTGAARLYFELRQKGKGVNPMPWLELGLRKVSKS